MLVAEFIDKEMGCWKAEWVRPWFLPCDGELILQIHFATLG